MICAVHWVKGAHTHKHVLHIIITARFQFSEVAAFCIMTAFFHASVCVSVCNVATLKVHMHKAWEFFILFFIGELNSRVFCLIIRRPVKDKDQLFMQVSFSSFSIQVVIVDYLPFTLSPLYNSIAL